MALQNKRFEIIGNETAAVSALAVLGAIALIFRRNPSPPAAGNERPAEARTSRPALERAALPNKEAAFDDRGRDASSPAQIPAKGWKDILVRVYHESSKDRIVTVAAGITFYGILALFPAIAALVSLYGLVADPATIGDQLASLSFFLPAGAFDIVKDQVGRIVSQNQNALGVKLFIGVAVSIWGANAGMKAIMDGLNIAYEEEEKRGFFTLNLISLALTLATVMAVLIALGSLAVLPLVLDTLNLSNAMKTALSILKWPVMLVIVLLGLSVLYRFGPSRAQPKWRWVTWGAAFATTLWILVSVGLSLYLSNFADYNKTYGSLGAVIGLMTWMWLSSCAVLIGGELNAETEHQTADDTTTGNPLPLGARSAKMADSVASSAG